MTVIKRDRKATSEDFVAALEKLIVLLGDQKEDEAIAFLNECLESFKNNTNNVSQQKIAVEQVVEAFNGEHELIAYTLQREGSGDSWTVADELSLVSSRVLNLARRMLKG